MNHYLAIAILLLLSGCASFGQDRWYARDDMKPAVSYEWIVTSGQQETTQRCARFARDKPAGWYVHACAMLLQVGPRGLPHCLVFSHFTEDVAKVYDWHGGEWGNLWRHEMRHCGLIDGRVFDHD